MEDRSMTVMTSREFNQDTSGAKRATADGPVFITDRGTPSHVLMSMAEYRRLTQQLSVADAFYVEGADEIELDIPKLSGDFGFKPVDFS
jgi:prevent-host-death family protein